MRIGIVNDLQIAVETLRRAIALEPGLEVAWVASNGQEAVEQCARDRPDVVLMDLIMPVMDGVEATRRIMAETPCAIVVVTVDVAPHGAGVRRHGLRRWTRPTRRWSAAPTCAARRPLLRKIRNIGWLIGRYGSRPTLTPVARPSEQPDSRRLLVIGASAGGPATLAQLLRDIPLDFPAGIVLVQHVDASFAAGMADWLNDQVPLPVRLVREGENRPPDRCCWPAPTTICICWPMVPCVTPRSPRKACTGPPLMYFSIAWRSTGAVWRWGCC